MQITEEKKLTIEEFFTMVSEDGGEYEIHTPDGWQDIGELFLNKKKSCYLIRTENGMVLGGSEEHLVLTDKSWQDLKHIDVNKHSVVSSSGLKPLVAKEHIGIHDTYDLQVLSEDRRYYSNDIVSHNCGKTTTARIMSMALNCEKGDGDPCLECDNCKMALKENSMHITEINMAKLNKKEDADAIVSDMHMTTLTGRNKIYIFDEAQMLTTAAQNLLLKNLEDPPPNTYIFMCTTDPEKILKGLRDRCEKYRFEYPGTEDIKLVLKSVFEQEKWTMSAEDKIKFLDYAKGLSIREILNAIDQAMNGGIDVLVNFSDPEKVVFARVFPMLLSGNFNGICVELKKEDVVNAEGLRQYFMAAFKNILVREGYSASGARIVDAMKVFKDPYFEAKPEPRLYMNLFEACTLLKR